MIKMIVAAALLATSASAAVPQKPTPTYEPSVRVCQAALVASVNLGTTDLSPLVEEVSAKLGFTPDQKETQRAICSIYYQGVADGIALASPKPVTA